MFFTRHLSKMLLVMGLATSACFLYAIAPEWGIVNILGLPYDENYASNYFDQGHYSIVTVWTIMYWIEQRSMFPDPEKTS